MIDEFHALEESLKNFFAEEYMDSRNTRSMNLYKYHNLKIYMDPKKSDIPHIVIRIGISEALYDIEKAEKISGGLGSDERIVRKWLTRNMGRLNLGTIWVETKKIKEIRLKKDGTVLEN